MSEWRSMPIGLQLVGILLICDRLLFVTFSTTCSPTDFPKTLVSFHSYAASLLDIAKLVNHVFSKITEANSELEIYPWMWREQGREDHTIKVETLLHRIYSGINQ